LNALPDTLGKIEHAQLKDSGVELSQATKDNIQKLIAGFVCIKYGRRGNPHPRFVYYNQSEEAICWRVSTCLFILVPCFSFFLISNFALGSAQNPNKKEKDRKIPIKDLCAVVEGCQTSVFQRYRKKIPQIQSQCFSLISNKRTLDLQFPSAEKKAMWAQLFQGMFGLY
jgi:hypothetical protein